MIILIGIATTISMARAAIAEPTPPASEDRVTDYGFPWARQNHNLCEELIKEPERRIPQNSWFCAGVDGDIFLRTLGTEDFYHGIGHWVQARAQAQPSENVQVNLRTIFYSGSISYGYTRPLGFFNLLGFSAQWPEEFLGGKIEARAMDLDRQSIGAGLILQDHETAGVLLRWTAQDYQLKFLGDGTGGLMLRDDLKNYEFSWRGGALSLGYIEWTEGTRIDPPFLYPVTYISSVVDWNETWSTAIELDHRHTRNAALARLSTRLKGQNWKLFLRLEGRHLDDGFGDQFVQRIEHLYTSYDQLDKRAMSTTNILSLDDHVFATSVDINFAWQLTERLEFHALNEAVILNFADLPRKDLFYYRWGLAYIPHADQSEALLFFFSNKVLSDSSALPPFLDSSFGGMLFKPVAFFGMEARLKF